MHRFWRTGIIPVLFFIFAAGKPLHAQVVRSWLTWRTVETKRFVFHYPIGLEDWTRDLAAHADAIDASVARIVGFTPTAKTHVVVDDPYNTANGSAWPFLNQPIINVWATPPDPRDDIGEYRDWGRTLLSHEFTHIAHLSRPSRNGPLRMLWKYAPVDLGPITINAPRWAIEGYATFAEGRVTGSGRPHGSWRPAFLRQWALEGQLPRYEQLNSFGSFEGGEFAYLAGSAFLEWLADKHGDSSLVDVWRRMTARQPRTFDEAFTGVYGESARALYGKFTADLTGKSLDIANRLRVAFPDDSGGIVQRLAWNTGDPAVSRDGRFLAISIGSPTQPSRIVIWSTANQPDTLRRKRDSIQVARDPEDVPARTIFPAPKRVLFSLRATSGSPYESPRFMADGRVIVSRDVRVGDGTLRPDLFIWEPQRGRVSRVTHGAVLRLPDPSPDAKSALALRCLNGWCDVALVDLATGRDSILLRGSPTRSYYRPRFSPDGSRYVVSMNENGRWRVMLVEGRTGQMRELPFHGNAYDASWVNRDAIVATSDVDGIPNLMALGVNATSPVRLTGVTGAAVAAEPVVRDSSIWFLSLYSRGYDLRRIAPHGRTEQPLIADDPRLAPAAMIPSVGVAPFASNAVSSPRPYGLGTRLFRWAPIPQADADGVAAMLAVSSSDLIGRSELIVRGAVGDRAEWHGFAVDGTWRGFRPFLHLGVFDAMQSPSASRSLASASGAMDVHMRGALAVLDGSSSFESWSARYRIAASSASLVGDSASRSLLVGDLATSYLQRLGTQGFSEALGASVTVGNTQSKRFYRGVINAGVNAFGFTPIAVGASASYAHTNADAPAFEQISLGGTPSQLVDRLLLTQRIAMGALPFDVVSGSSALTYRLQLNTQPLNAYFWSGSTTTGDARFAAWHRVIGLEAMQAVSPIPVAGVPGARILYGIGESLDAPFRKQLRGYLSVAINP